MMPDMDGFTLAERIRAGRGASTTSRSSARRRPEVAAMLAALPSELRVAAYLVKPIKQSELLR